MSDMFGTRPPFQGFGLLRGVVPRALPWAGLIRPFGAGESRTLAMLRDARLPNLLSGELLPALPANLANISAPCAPELPLLPPLQTLVQGRLGERRASNSAHAHGFPKSAPLRTH
jgi:hypothetical protein